MDAPRKCKQFRRCIEQLAKIQSGKCKIQIQLEYFAWYVDYLWSCFVSFDKHQDGSHRRADAYKHSSRCRHHRHGDSDLRTNFITKEKLDPKILSVEKK